VKLGDKTLQLSPGIKPRTVSSDFSCQCWDHWVTTVSNCWVDTISLYYW